MKVKSITQINLFIIGVSLFFIAFKWSDFPPQVPLFYSRPWGEEQLASKYSLILLPGISLLSLATNGFLSGLFTRKELDLFARASSLTSLAVSILLLTSLWKIIFLIT